VLVAAPTFSFAAPDLVVTALWTDPLAPAQGQTYTVKATVKNQGAEPATAGEGRFVRCHFLLDSTDLGYAQFATLAVGASITLSQTRTAPYPGTYTLKAVVDKAAGVAESDEKNNERTAKLTVPAPRHKQASKPRPFQMSPTQRHEVRTE
jgi:subtilase family serine protease